MLFYSSFPITAFIMKQISYRTKFAAIKYRTPALIPQDHFKRDDGHILSISLADAGP